MRPDDLAVVGTSDCRFKAMALTRQLQKMRAGLLPEESRNRIPHEPGRAVDYSRPYKNPQATTEEEAYDA